MPSSLRARVMSPPGGVGDPGVRSNCLRVEVVRASRSGTAFQRTFSVVPRRGVHRQVGHEGAAVGRVHRLEGPGVVGEVVEAAAARGVAVRAPAVEQAVGAAGVLGAVDVAAPGVDDDGLVREAPEGLDRAGVVRVARVVRVDLEDVAVVLADVLGGVGQLLGLLAGEPGAPRADPAGAVGPGAGERDDLGDAPAAAVDGDRRRAALGAALVVGDAGAVGHGGRHRVGVAVAVLVVRHEHPAAAAAGEGAGAVVARGAQLAAVVEGRRGDRVAAVPATARTVYEKPAGRSSRPSGSVTSGP